MREIEGKDAADFEEVVDSGGAWRSANFQESFVGGIARIVAEAQV